LWSRKEKGRSASSVSTQSDTRASSTASGLDDSGLVQGTLFDSEEREKQSRVDAVADQIKEQFGVGAIRRGSGLSRDGKD